MTWIDKYKGAGPWEFEKIELEKNPGSWPFIPQPDKPHYNEGNLISNADNPVWEMDFPGPLVTPVHNPWCGYWGGRGKKEDIEANIFVLNWSHAHTIYGVYFDGESLKYIGKYSPTEDITGLILYENDLLTVAGEKVTAELRRISAEAVAEELSLLNTYNSFNSYDIRNAFDGRLVNGDSGKFYYADPSTVIVSVHELSRDKRGFRNTVITGTDGNLYVLKADNFWWEDDWRPITGGRWHLFWDLIEDNICDTTITSWGGEIIKCGSVLIDTCYHNGYLYTIDFSSYTSPLTKIDPTSLETVARHGATSYLNRVTVHGNKVYVMGGVTNTTVYIFNASDLSLVCSMALPDGRAADGDLEIVGNHLIVSTTTYGFSPATLYKLSLDDLFIIDSILSEDGTDVEGGQRLAIITDVYVTVAWNNGVSVFNIGTMSLVDRLSVSPSSAFGYHAQAVVVKHL